MIQNPRSKIKEKFIEFICAACGDALKIRGGRWRGDNMTPGSWGWSDVGDGLGWFCKTCTGLALKAAEELADKSPSPADILQAVKEKLSANGKEA